MTDSGALADVLLGGPWDRELLCRRTARHFGRMLVSTEVRTLIDAVLIAYPVPPAQDVLTRFLAARPGPHPDADAEPPDAAPAPIVIPDGLRDATRRIATTLPDVAALAALLGIDTAELAWFADVHGWERRAPAQLRHYRWRALPRPGHGVRLVAAPKPRLKEIQRRLLGHVLAAIPVHDAAHGCVTGRSVRTAVAPHTRADVLVRADLESFFPSLHAGRVHGLLLRTGLPQPAAELIAGLCTTVVPRAVWLAVERPPLDGLPAYHRLGERLRSPHAPQGAPTSPAIANALAFRLDRRLSALSARFGALYTRYVDDLIFSGGHGLRHEGFLMAVRAVVLDEGFRLNERKTLVATKAARQAVLGAVVNDHATIARPERDRLRAIVHNCLVHGGPSQARGRPQFRAELLGRIAALAGLDPVLGARLRESYDRIDWS